jgi:hypothetical protein
MSSSQPAPQFDKADFGQQPKGDVCHKCRQSIVGAYYRLNGAMTCASCANILQHDATAQPSGNYTRALLFGCGGALLGLVLYSAVGIITGLMIGYVSLAVGFIVAKAMLKGSGGIGGRKYQITAVLLTYMAVSMSAIPIALSQWGKDEHPGAKPQQTQQASATDNSTPAEAAEVSQSSSSQAQDTAKPEAPGMSFVAAIGLLAGIGLASPFLALAEPVQGIIGLVILFVGMNIAWRMTAGSLKPAIEGPYTA